ncbi:hypothetical protein BDR03DRAFT_957710 [Suillus americanus]|nr:hypothetical protein BDR03DRAFT_957710 [Suillus americanus]
MPSLSPGCLLGRSAVTNESTCMGSHIRSWVREYIRHRIAMTGSELMRLLFRNSEIIVSSPRPVCKSRRQRQKLTSIVVCGFDVNDKCRG